jgi:hypothetical protein
MKRLPWLLLAACLLNLQCGYRLSGRGRNLPPAAKTIAIPDFKNLTTRPQVEQFITFALRDEFIKRSRLRLTQAQETADLLLEGKITAFTTTPLSYSTAGAANLYDVAITLDVILIDTKKNELFFQGKGVVFHETYETDAADFFSQETGSLAKIAAKFASSIVAAILDNF